MKKRVLSIMLCMGITMAFFVGCGSADQKKAARENTEAVQETGTEALSKLMDNTEEATEVAEVTETTDASETSDPAASVDASAVSAEASASENDAAASSSTAKADTKNKTAAKSGSKSDSTSGSASQASQPAAASGSGSAKADNTTQAAAPAQTQQASSAQPASQPAQPAAHEHQWEQYVKDTIDHPEVGHYETKVVQAAYDEPQYDWHNICNKCGADLGTDDWNVINHEDVCDGSYRADLVQVGSIHHDAVTEQVYVVDQAAWTENVYGYRCSCGATK